MVITIITLYRLFVAKNHSRKVCLMTTNQKMAENPFAGEYFNSVNYASNVFNVNNLNCANIIFLEI